MDDFLLISQRGVPQSPGNGMTKATAINGGKTSIFDPSDLDLQSDFDGVFILVKKAVKVVTGRERSGLGLAMSNLPVTVGAYWQVGGNYIVMNEILLHEMSKIARDNREFNSFVFMILAHEYLHSVGYIDERNAREMTRKVAEAAFGRDHPAYLMSSDDIWRLYPQLLQLRGGDGSKLKIVEKFDSSSLDYFA